MSWLHASNPVEALALIGGLYETRGQSKYDEAVTQVEHALQSAAHAERDGAAPALIAAALLHDIGHLASAEPDGKGRPVAADRRHEVVGCRALATWFGPAVTEPIRLHVDAKRYLCTNRDTYAGTLSAASQRSLIVQGGTMSAVEHAAFEAEEFSADAVRLREWDDRAKVVDCETPTFLHYEPLLRSLVGASADRPEG